MAYYCAVPLLSKPQYRARRPLLNTILREVNDGSYSCQRLHGFLSTPKGNSVGRFVPVLTFSDTAVYFACMQHIDRDLATEAVPQTFGGWRLGNARRMIEEEEAIRLLGEDSPSIPQSCYNRAAWVQQWNQYWKLAAAKHAEASEAAWFAVFDIANFYDSIDLRRLETGVRAVSRNTHFATNVLFHLLGSWNKALSLYSQSTKGLPMDVVGDCSRLLANFFLTPFDRSFRQFVTERDGDYMRFADDMVVRAESREECEQFVYEGSQQLHRLGLNINVAKVRYCSKKEFDQFWGFVIMDRFEQDQIEEGLVHLKRLVDTKEFGRKPTALKRAVTLVARQNNAEFRWWRKWVRQKAIEESLPLHLSREQLSSLIELYDDPNSALDELVPIFLDQPFSQPKAILLRVLERLGGKNAQTLDRCTEVLRRLSDINDPVLNLCVDHVSSSLNIPTQ
jgi:hypothetical protein